MLKTKYQLAFLGSSLSKSETGLKSSFDILFVDENGVPENIQLITILDQESDWCLTDRSTWKTTSDIFEKFDICPTEHYQCFHKKTPAVNCVVEKPVPNPDPTCGITSIKEIQCDPKTATSDLCTTGDTKITITEKQDCGTCETGTCNKVQFTCSKGVVTYFVLNWKFIKKLFYQIVNSDF